MWGAVVAVLPISHRACKPGRRPTRPDECREYLQRVCPTPACRPILERCEGLERSPRVAPHSPRCRHRALAPIRKWLVIWVRGIFSGFGLQRRVQTDSQGMSETEVRLPGLFHWKR